MRNEVAALTVSGAVGKGFQYPAQQAGPRAAGFPGELGILVIRAGMRSVAGEVLRQWGAYCASGAVAISSI